MSNLFAIAVPVQHGKEQEFEQFRNELRTTRFEDFKASRQKLGVRERTFYQQTPMGGFVIVTLEGENPSEAFQHFASASDSFTQWFAGKVKEIHGIDLSSPPPGPLPEMFIDSGFTEEVLA